MSNQSKTIKVIAADIKTGTILDRTFQWYTQEPNQEQWVKYFENRALAEEFCEITVGLHPDFEFWIYEGDLEPHRIVNNKCKR